MRMIRSAWILLKIKELHKTSMSKSLFKSKLNHRKPSIYNEVGQLNT
jgi:hypothetical protein